MVEASLAVLATTGDLTGNWSWTVWLLIPTALVLAYVTARCVGPDGDPPRSRSSAHGVSDYLARTLAEKDVR